MLSVTQASLSTVYAAATVRLADYARALLEEEQKEWPDPKEIERWEWRLIDLRLGIEKAALESDEGLRDVGLGYLQETHRLLAAYADPLLRSLLPPLAAGGNVLVPIVLNVNGYDVVVNGFLVGLGFAIMAGVPLYNTDLMPGQNVGSIAYNGLPDTIFSLDVPVPMLSGDPLYLRLFVGPTQVGRVDFPDSLLGQGFSISYGDNLYGGVFQETGDSTLSLN